jgi:hypothetical protein
MNPSASGWIKKFGEFIKPLSPIDLNMNDLYIILKKNRFVYGYSSAPIFNFNLDQKLSQDEIEKLNLMTGFYYIYNIYHEKFNFNDFIFSLLNFFNSIEVVELTLWDKFIAGKDARQQLERIIHEHVQIDQNIFTKHFNKQTTNSLLFLDLLAYNKFLEDKIDAHDYLKEVEYIILNITNDIYAFKKERKKEKKSALKQISNSIYYQKKNNHDIDINYRRFIETNFNFVEKQYFLDLAAFTIWEPVFEDDKSYNFIKALGIDMNLDALHIESALNEMTLFYEETKSTSIFKTSNKLNNFYDNSSQLVIKLIKRNSKRILKEISQSKELMVLLTQSTVRDLSKEEQEKVQYQLIDILKTIPSLAIFLLPGGAILLPIFVKLLPNMMPSAFDDNKTLEN